MGLILDTNILVTMEREARRGVSGRIERFLTMYREEILLITFTVAGELACGRSMTTRPQWEQLIFAYPVLPWTRGIAWQYGELFRHLQSRGEIIGSNDLWIAATALVHGMGIITNNVNEFRRIPNLRVIAY